MGLTAQEIAKRVGLSGATVSRVLHDRPNVSPEARDAVMAVVRESGRMPRLLQPRTKPQAAGHPRLVRILNVMRFPITRIDATPESGFSVTRGDISRDRFFAPEARLATSYSRHIIDGIVDELRHFDLRAVIQVTENLRSAPLLAEVNRKDNVGVFILGIYDDDVHGFLDKCRCPVVSFMTWSHDGWPDYVGIDNARGIRLAFEHVRQLGHTRIGFVAGELRYSAVFRERLSAFRSLCAEDGLTPKPEWIVEGSCDLDTIRTAARTVLAGRVRPTAMLCAFDGAALAIKSAADALRLRVPDDLSVIGFDDEDIAHVFSPPLTAVRVPTVLMGRQAVQLLTMRLQRPIRRGEGCSARVAPTLIARQSTAAPRH